jgi:hypothetical protein
LPRFALPTYRDNKTFASLRSSAIGEIESIRKELPRFALPTYQYNKTVASLRSAAIREISLIFNINKD